MGIPWDGMGWDRHELLWNGMGWDRKICPMDKPGFDISCVIFLIGRGFIFIIITFEIIREDKNEKGHQIFVLYSLWHLSNYLNVQPLKNKGAILRLC